LGQVSQSAAPTVEDNVLMEGLGGGIVVHDSAGGLYRRNEIRRNAQAGLGIIGDAAPVAPLP
jgi:parallel beta-helix repeat protein